MIEALWARWLLTSLFVLAGGYCLARCWVDVRKPTVDRSVSTWISDVAHVAMSVSMVAMTWWGTGWDALGLQAALFVLLCGWFTLRAVGLSGAASGSGSLRRTTIYEAVAMGAMAWMLLRMNAEPHHHQAANVTSGDTAGNLLPTIVTLVLVLLLGLAAGGWFIRLFTAMSGATTRQVFGPAGASGCHLLMSIGMVISAAALL
ncbi:DUF5134 domain-containing protein [Micromonospora sp. WMMA1923]|uniref:DUF5134 domain-containing protein n=1 Tax=Micromonospora sp. WMMA1923 TaxID=3404125 RepID=UPI003B94857A